MEEKLDKDINVRSKLTDEEIVKALECKVGGCMICESVNAGCPYDMKSYCDHEKHLKDILDLIHRLQDENERLTEENGQLKGYNSGLEYENVELQKRVDELKAKNEHLESENDRLIDEVSKLLDEGWDIMDKEAEICHNRGYAQAVEETVKEIYDYIKSIEEHGLPTSCVGEWVKNRLKERYSVEVE